MAQPSTTCSAATVGGEIPLNHLRLETVALDQLKVPARQLRKHPPQQIRKIAESLRRFGWVSPILIDPEGRVVAGQARIAAARTIDLTTAPAVSIHHLTEAELRAYTIADNRLAEEASWDPDALKLEIGELIDLDIEIELTGFETAEIDLILADPEAGDDPAADRTPEPAKVALSQPGDLWLIGPHRLLCGDALDPDSYRRLLDGTEVQAVFTDPPYNVPIAGHVCGLGKVQHREFAMASGEMSPAQFADFLHSVCTRAGETLMPGGIVFVCIDWRSAAPLIVQAERAGLELLNLCVWTKTNAGMGGLYRSQHELVPVFKKPGKAHVNNVQLGKHGRNRSNVWSYAGINAFGATREADLADHPTVKPVALVADAIQDVTRRGDTVLDPFGGSGTTMAAAHKTGRSAALIELDPIYVDVILRRMAERFDLHAVHAETGQSFAEIAAARSVTTATIPSTTDATEAARG